jgi:peroxiredoxin
MKDPFRSLLYALVIFQFGCSTPDKSVLEKTSEKLQAFKTLKYVSVNKNYDFMAKKLNKIDTLIFYFSFNPADTITGAKYVYSHNKTDYGFDGKTTFFTLKDKSQLVHRTVKSYGDLLGSFALFYSIQHLRKLLPQMLIDTAFTITKVRDTVIYKSPCYQFNIIMRGKTLRPDIKDLIPKKNYWRSFKLMINKDDFLPRQFISYTNEYIPVNIMTYYNFKINTEIDPDIFDYKKRNKDYVRYGFEEYQALSRQARKLKQEQYKGLQAVDWTLPDLNGDSIRLSKIHSDLILLEFWFPGCIGCVQAIPELNRIYKTYAKKGLRLYGIEFTNYEKKHIVNYAERMNINYPILYSGKGVAGKYGVSAGPTLFLIDRNGKIIYSSSGFKKEELVRMIEKHI